MSNSLDTCTSPHLPSLRICSTRHMWRHNRPMLGQTSSQPNPFWCPYSPCTDGSTRHIPPGYHCSTPHARRQQSGSQNTHSRLESRRLAGQSGHLPPRCSKDLQPQRLVQTATNADLASCRAPSPPHAARAVSCLQAAYRRSRSCQRARIGSPQKYRDRRDLSRPSHTTQRMRLRGTCAGR
jgi:hypothetical protein